MVKPLGSVGLILILLILTACTTAPVLLGRPYSRAVQNDVYALRKWSLDGRLAVAANKDSWSATLNWQHDVDVEQINLSGPLGQGAARIRLTKNQVVIDRGGKNVQTSNNPEEFIQQQLGMMVPIHSLRYWVVGLPEPEQDFIETADGFKQGQWLIEYKEMQQAGKYTMPRKVFVINSQVKLKVIIDQWTVADAK
jgi:outer membrane lipoprotein LolB